MIQWIPKVEICPKLLSYINDLTLPEQFQNDVNYFKDGLVTASPIPWHTDGHCDQYSFIFVLRNDSNYKVQQWKDCSNDPQPIGTALILDLHKKHRLHGGRLGKYWAAFVKDFAFLPTKMQCEFFLNEYLEKWK